MFVKLALNTEDIRTVLPLNPGGGGGMRGNRPLKTIVCSIEGFCIAPKKRIWVDVLQLASLGDVWYNLPHFVFYISKVGLKGRKDDQLPDTVY